jgi:membrane fusion protein (multidrug efflux system)
MVLLAAALLAAAGGYGWNWWMTGRFTEATDDAYVGGDVTAIASRVAGFVDRVAVTDNQPVRQGDLLIKLDDRDYRARLARADAAIAAQLASLANLDANRLLQQAVIAQSRAEIAATDAEVIRARYDVERYRDLAKSQASSQQRYQQADADYKKALAAALKAQAALAADEQRLAVIDTQKQQAQAGLDQARAERDLASLDLSFTEIHAPIDGVVGNRSARTGFYATAGVQLLSLVPATGLWVDANFKESQLGHIRPGQPVAISADTLPGLHFSGTVTSLAPATGAQFSVIPPENATGNFTKIVQRVPVRIRLEGDAGRLGALRPGLSVSVAIDQRPAAEAERR